MVQRDTSIVHKLLDKDFITLNISNKVVIHDLTDTKKFLLGTYSVPNLHKSLIKFSVHNSFPNFSLVSIVQTCNIYHWMKSVCIRSYSGPYFPAFGLNKERYGVCECGKIRSRITPNTDTFHAVYINLLYKQVEKFCCKCR